MEQKLCVRLPGCSGSVELPPNRINHVVENAFSYGQCHALAIALSRELGAPARVVISSRALSFMKMNEQEFLALAQIPDRVVARHWDHAVVEIGPDKYLDVNGVRTLAEIRGGGDKYQPSTVYVVPTSEDQLLRLSANYHSGLRPNVRVATHYAPLVIERYLGPDYVFDGRGLSS